MTVHCPSLSAELLESELFGHVRGAFTGAVQDTVGKVAVAEGGTLFLDEIGDLPPALQPKLLRLLAGEAATSASARRGPGRRRAASWRPPNRNLEAAIAAGKFREDLLYRLNVIEVRAAAARAAADILPLAEHLLHFFAGQSGKALAGFTREAEAVLLRYSWPGNVRELRNTVERGVILAAGEQVDCGDLPAQIGRPRRAAVEVGGRVTFEELEAEHLRRRPARHDELG